LRHAWDRNFFLLYIGLIWVGILAGFVPEIVRHVSSGAAPFPIIVHIHAVFFVGWLLFLTSQEWLIRNRRVRLHRRLGVAGAVLASLMVIVGWATALTVQSFQLGSPGDNPAFLSVQLIDMIEFGALVAAAIGARNHPSAHKRLILLATISLADAGFSRWVGAWHYGHLGEGFWPFFFEFFGASALLIFGIGAYDLVTRQRLHPAYVLGAAWIFVGQLSASWLYYQPGWKATATSIIRAWPW
jgi:hypothetical protein